MELGYQAAFRDIHNFPGECGTYRNSDELKGNVADCDIDSVQYRKGSEDQVFPLCKSSRYLPYQLRYQVKDLVIEGLTKAPLSNAK